MEKSRASAVKIEQAANEAVRVIAQAAEAAARVVANAAAESVKVANIKSADDHDLLIELKTKLDGLKADIKDIKDGTSRRIDNMETEKLDAKDSYFNLYKDGVDKHVSEQEVRLTVLELSKTRQNVMMSIGIGILTILVSLIVFHILH
jgi:hypothetical protein